MTSFSEMPQDTIYMSTTLSVLLLCSCACLVCRKEMEPKCDLPNCLLWPCIVCMCNRKQKAWVWISALWIQIMMSVPRCTIVHSVWHLVVCLDFLVTSMFPNWNIRWPTSVQSIVTKQLLATFLEMLLIIAISESACVCLRVAWDQGYLKSYVMQYHYNIGLKLVWLLRTWPDNLFSWLVQPGAIECSFCVCSCSQTKLCIVVIM